MEFINKNTQFNLINKTHVLFLFYTLRYQTRIYKEIKMLSCTIYLVN